MYHIRTDLAVENRELYHKEFKEDSSGVEVENLEGESYKVTRVKILNEMGSRDLNKPIGNYITIDLPQAVDINEDLKDNISQVLAKELKGLWDQGPNSKILIIGLGNWNITPDALGPRVVERVLVTRHLHVNHDFDLGESFANVAALSPGVMGITGIETGDVILAIVNKIKPDLVIAIDALASKNINRISTSIQISDSGISPGAGVGNKRMELNSKTLGLPVIAIGIPTVVDAATIVNDTLDLIIEDLKKETRQAGEFYNILSQIDSNEKYRLIKEVLNPYMQNIIVTPTDIDKTIEDLSIIVANGVNMALHPGIDLKDYNRYIR